MATAPMGMVLRQIQRLLVDGSLASLADSELLERFLSEGDEAAFTALVERHGPMVLGTCRAVLRDANAAEDAFQATSLVLIGISAVASVAGSALASWVYQVAHRIAPGPVPRQLADESENNSPVKRKQRTAIASSRTMSGDRSSTKSVAI